MCGRFYVPEDDSIQMIRAIVEYLEHRNVKAKTGDIFPGDIAAVVASNRHLEPQPFAMEWGYHLSDGKRMLCYIERVLSLLQHHTSYHYRTSNDLLKAYCPNR